MKLLGLDIGSKRIGVATLIPPGTTPLRVGCFDRAQGRAEKEILKIIKEKQIELVIAGLPTDENGKETEMCNVVRKFCTRLSKRMEIPIEFVDEWGSSIDAKQSLKIRRSDSKMRKSGLIDAEAASIILQIYVNQSRTT